MADKKNTGSTTPGPAAKQASKPSAPKPSPGEFIRQVRAETSKVVWPTRQETITTAIFVGIMMILLSLFFLGIDTVFGALVTWLISLA
ncbi:MAG: preprotein translocase subunit SecE [Pontixanthobacter sp.]